MDIYQNNNIFVSEIDGRFWVYGYDEQKHQCLSVGRGNPKDSGQWFANGAGDAAIKYVGIPYDKRDSAVRYARKLATGK